MTEKKCLFCGGPYEKKIDTIEGGQRHRNMVSNYGIAPSGNKHVVILICKQCGHMVIFMK